MYKIILIIGFLIILFLIVIQIIYKKLLKKNYLTNLKSQLDMTGLFYSINRLDKNTYHLLLDKMNYYLFIEILPNHSQLQINNKTTWELRTGGGQDYGKAPNKISLLTSIVPFMNKDFDGKKVVVILPKTKKIVMYINECEMIVVNSKTNVHGCNIINGDDFSLFKNE